MFLAVEVGRGEFWAGGDGVVDGGGDGEVEVCEGFGGRGDGVGVGECVS